MSSHVPRQGRSDILITTCRETIWAILSDPQRIPEWAPMVRSVETPDGQREHLGAVRRCRVDMNGKTGEVVEQCIACRPHSTLSHMLVDDTLGFGRMLSDFAFTFSLQPADNGATRVTLETYYAPRGLSGMLFNALMLRRRFGRLRKAMLSNLQRLATVS